MKWWIIYLCITNNIMQIISSHNNYTLTSKWHLIKYHINNNLNSDNDFLNIESIWIVLVIMFLIEVAELNVLFIYVNSLQEANNIFALGWTTIYTIFFTKHALLVISKTIYKLDLISFITYITFFPLYVLSVWHQLLICLYLHYSINIFLLFLHFFNWPMMSDFLTEF